MTRCCRLFALLAVCLAPQFAAAWDSATLAEPVVVNGHTIPYPVFAIFVMPGSTISAGLADGSGAATLTFRGQQFSPDIASVVAPKKPGLDVLEIRNATSGEICRIHVFTLVPAGNVTADGMLNGYRIGEDPQEPLRGLDIYLPPQGFVEVTAENALVKVSPNLTLGEFVSKQESGYPKYEVLRSSLLLKLENILRTLNESGHKVDRFVIMSGYRTPHYNRAIGNVQYSRHVWGGAADIYIDDSPRDGMMDDLNGDGRIDRDDAEWLANLVDEMSHNDLFGPRIGGLGFYGSTSAHGPFIHVDVSGSRARW
jgi:hypothetical protein